MKNSTFTSTYSMAVPYELDCFFVFFVTKKWPKYKNVLCRRSYSKNVKIAILNKKVTF